MKPKVERGRRVVLWLGVTCLGLLPMALSCSSQKTPGAAEANEQGLSHAEKGDHDQAIADFTEAIRLNQTQPVFYVSRARAYRALGDEAKAASDEKKAQELKN